MLGRNERQLKYIRQNNLRPAIKIADDKVLTKRILSKHEIPVPQKIGVISNNRQLEKFDFSTLPPSFVIKPVKGVRGSGVEIFYNRDKNGKWIKSDGSRIDENEIKALARDILDGRYSLFNEPDRVLIEERIRPHKNFKYFAFKGTPDIRVIVYNSIPVMGMLRLPTKESDGKANLDLGAIGTGIDMAVGKTTSAVIGKGTPIDTIKEYRLPLSGLRIPFWDRILKYSIEASRVTKLGYAAVDFLIDKEKGPVVVELNARPGLSIQVANQDGLGWRLKKAQGVKVKTVDQGIRLAKDLFGGEIEEEIETISGKRVIGLSVNVILYGNNKSEEVKAKVDTGASLTSIDKELAIRLGYSDVIEFADKILSEIPRFNNIDEAKEYSASNNLEAKLREHPDIYDTAIIKSSNGISYRISINIKMEVSGALIETHATVSDRSNLNYSMIIGEKDLKNFLIDASKKN